MNRPVRLYRFFRFEEFPSSEEFNRRIEEFTSDGWIPGHVGDAVVMLVLVDHEAEEAFRASQEEKQNAEITSRLSNLLKSSEDPPAF